MIWTDKDNLLAKTHGWTSVYAKGWLEEVCRLHRLDTHDLELEEYHRDDSHEIRVKRFHGDVICIIETDYEVPVVRFLVDEFLPGELTQIDDKLKQLHLEANKYGI